MVVMQGISGFQGLSVSGEDPRMLLTLNVSLKGWAEGQALCQLLGVQSLRMLLWAGWPEEPDANMPWACGSAMRKDVITQHRGFVMTDRGGTCGHSRRWPELHFPWRVELTTGLVQK